ncbi:alpha/beta hydrolase [soil metagenome]
MRKALKFLGYFTLLLLVLILSQLRCNIPVEKLKPIYTNADSKFIEVDNMQVHYRIEGNGPPLVLLHGMAASLHTWEGWAKELKTDFRVISIDLPAFGLTGPNPSNDYSIKFYVDFLHLFLDKLGIHEFHLAGNSLGGLIAWNYALTYPHQVKKLILIDAAGYKKMKDAPFVFKLARTPIVKDVMELLSPKYLVRMSLKDVYGSDSLVTDALVDRYYDLLLREGNRKAFVQRTNGGFEFQTNRIHEIETPTLIMWGEQDKWILLEDGQKFNDELPNSELIVYPGVGHVPMEEAPAKTAADARAFLLKAL